MIYRADITIDAHILIEADSQEDAEARIGEGYLLSDIIFDDDCINNVYPEE